MHFYTVHLYFVDIDGQQLNLVLHFLPLSDQVIKGNSAGEKNFHSFFFPLLSHIGDESFTLFRLIFKYGNFTGDGLSRFQLLDKSGLVRITACFFARLSFNFLYLSIDFNFITVEWS